MLTDHFGGTDWCPGKCVFGLEAKREAHTDSSKEGTPTHIAPSAGRGGYGVSNMSVSCTLAAMICACPTESRSRTMRRQQPGGNGANLHSRRPAQTAFRGSLADLG